MSKNRKDKTHIKTPIGQFIQRFSSYIYFLSWKFGGKCIWVIQGIIKYILFKNDLRENLNIIYRYSLWENKNYFTLDFRYSAKIIARSLHTSFRAKNFVLFSLQISRWNMYLNFRANFIHLLHHLPSYTLYR